MNPIVKVITWIVEAVIGVIENRANRRSSNGADHVPIIPPIQPYPRKPGNGLWDPDKTDPQMPHGHYSPHDNPRGKKYK